MTGLITDIASDENLYREGRTKIYFSGILPDASGYKRGPKCYGQHETTYRSALRTRCREYRHRTIRCALVAVGT